MIAPRTTISPREVARHYDELDDFYRRIWGEHVHHGYWESERDPASVEEATLRLLQEVVSPLGLEPGAMVADIGCGYGASARWVAAQYRARVRGLTISPGQAASAREFPEPLRGSAKIVLADWLHNDLADASLEAAYAIESLAHMTDKVAFFGQLARTLKPGGRAALACWLAAPDLSLLERPLMRAICHEGRLPGMGTMREYTALARSAGLEVLETRDLSREVERTWWIISRRVLRGFFSDTRYLRFLLNRAFRERLFVVTLPRLLLAFRTGAMRYGIIQLGRPRQQKGEKA